MSASTVLPPRVHCRRCGKDGATCVYFDPEGCVGCPQDPVWKQHVTEEERAYWSALSRTIGSGYLGAQ
jgi:hypothetical protein